MKEGNSMRFIVTIFWGEIFFEVMGFIAASLTSMKFDPVQSAIIGLIFSIAYALIIPAINAKSHKDDSKFGKML